MVSVITEYQDTVRGDNDRTKFVLGIFVGKRLVLFVAVDIELSLSDFDLIALRFEFNKNQNVLNEVRKSSILVE